MRWFLTAVGVAALVYAAFSIEVLRDREGPDAAEMIFLGTVSGSLALLMIAVFVHFGRFA